MNANSRLLLILAASLFLFAQNVDAQRKPNIVIIMADDMGYSDAGCMGGEMTTPNLDSLAAGGVRFTQFYNTARCCPTRAALLTGLYSHMAGMGGMTGRAAPNAPGYAAELSQDAVTVAEVLKTAGYATYMTGKWHVTSQDRPKASKDNWPLQRGFDHYYGTVKGGGSYYDPAMLTRDNKPITPEGDLDYQPEHFYYTTAIADQTVSFIHQHHDNAAEKPFFMYVAFTSPHWPLHAPADVVAKYKGKYDAGYEPFRAKRFAKMKEMGLIDAKWELSPQAQKWEDQEHKEWEARCMEVYAAQIEMMDRGIGNIVDALKQTGSLDDTLIMFLQDNGACAEQMGRTTHEDRAKAAATQPRKSTEIQLEVFPKYTPDGRPIKDGPNVMPGPDDSYVAYGQGWANVSNTPFREYKHWVHEGGISTPLIAHWPAGISRHGEMERQPGHLIDLMATCVELSGATYPKEKGAHAVPPMAGVSLVKAFKGEPLGRGKPIFFEHEGNRAARDGKWKIVAKRGTPWELYDVENDRTEMHDLAAKEPDRLKSMADTWEKWAGANQVLPMNPFAKGAAAPKPE